MKNLHKTIWGSLALIAAIGFALMACGNPAGGGGSPGGGAFISGTLSSDLGPGPLMNIARSVESTTQTFSANLGSDGKTLSGLLQDGSITFTLTGEYDSATRSFSMQAPSSMIIFTIAGRLNPNNSLNTAETNAAVMVKTGNEWTNTPLTITPSDQSVTGTANADQTGVTSIPVYCRGTLVDQITGELKYIITRNSITMLEPGEPPMDITVVEVTNANGAPADENGPWHFIVRTTYDPGDLNIDYTGKFYVSKTFDATLTSAIGSSTIADITWGHGDTTPLSTAAAALGSVRAFVVPYTGTGANVNTNGIHPAIGGYSPLFVGASATANAKTATTLRAISGFVLALQ